MHYTQAIVSPASMPPCSAPCTHFHIRTYSFTFNLNNKNYCNLGKQMNKLNFLFIIINK